MSNLRTRKGMAVAVKIVHITTGQAGIHADDSAVLRQAIAAVEAAGYRVDNIEDDATEPIHAATIHYSGGPQTLRTLKTIVA